MLEVAPVAAGRRPGWYNTRLVIQVFLGTRLLFLLLALALVATEGRTLESMLSNWDVAHFLAIAENGYRETNDVAFFPGWPLILRGFGLLGLPELASGVVLALIASALAAAALQRMAGSGAAIAWLLAPTAIFTAVPYTESLFCAAAFWAWERASARRWGAAAVLAALAASVRVSGLFLIGALAVLALTQTGDWRARLRRLLWLGIPMAVIAAYAGYLRVVRGSWTAWYTAQSTGWSREMTSPWVSLQHTLDAAAPGAYPDHPEWSWVFRAELISMAVGIVVTLVALWRRRLAEASWVGVQVLAFSTSYWFMSVNRAVLLWFPLWTMIGSAADPDRPPSRARSVLIGLVVAVAVAVQLIWAWLFLTGRWSS